MRSHFKRGYDYRQVVTYNYSNMRGKYSRKCKPYIEQHIQRIVAQQDKQIHL